MDDWLTIFLQNCQGLLDVTKRRDLLLRKKCKKKKHYIKFLKDVHTNSKLEKFVKDKRGYEAHFGSYTTVKMDVMV